MWCIPKLTPEYIERMENILELYEKPYNPQEPVLCFDEKSKQMIEDTRAVKNAKEGVIRKRDYEYKRNGMRNIFVTVEPKAGYREATVTTKRKRPDFAKEMKRIMELPRYKNTTKIHIVFDNLNTHSEKSLQETFGLEESKRLTDRIMFHYTPKHASWLNMAEIEIGILNRQYLGKRVPDEVALKNKALFYMDDRNTTRATIQWKFTVKDARIKFKYEGSKLN